MWGYLTALTWLCRPSTSPPTAIDRTIDRSDQTIDRPNDQSIAWKIVRSIERFIDQMIDQSNQPSIDHSAPKRSIWIQFELRGPLGPLSLNRIQILRKSEAIWRVKSAHFVTCLFHIRDFIRCHTCKSDGQLTKWSPPSGCQRQKGGCHHDNDNDHILPWLWVKLI